MHEYYKQKKKLELCVCMSLQSQSQVRVNWYLNKQLFAQQLCWIHECLLFPLVHLIFYTIFSRWRTPEMLMYCSAIGRVYQLNIFTLNLETKKNIFFAFVRWNFSLNLSPVLNFLMIATKIKSYYLGFANSKTPKI